MFACEKKREEEQKKRLVEKVLSYQYQGEVYILTHGRIWKSLVLKYFKKVDSGELSIEQLLQLLEEKGGVKYGQSYKLVRYPIEECLNYIAKLSKKK
ncbi:MULTISPECIES: hypothetical protein [unclassified Cytobacillus]|uniref:hypothetical protein n=1 Tax=unclassified Cytobacillus TaxID=2675268 RepID=UPI0020414759|nr:hypothetical protein [Cytobacillus sp. AMY 15.2]MCM3092202.1 hypothetical protein [Cytobacillus sp. AMY 15.2]